MTGAQEKALDRLRKKHTVSFDARGDEVTVTYSVMKYGVGRFVRAAITPDGRVLEKS